METRSVLRERPLWLLVALVLVFFHEPLTTGTFYFRDIYQFFQPKRVLLARSLTAGEIPLWDPMTNGGQPFLATPSNTPFYPSNVLLFLFDPTTAFNLAIVLQYVLCAIFAYWLARVVRLSPAGAFTAGALFALAGCSLSTANLLPLLLALPWIPLTLGCTHLYLRTRRHRWLTFAAIAAAMPLLAAAVELTAMMFTLITVWIALARYDASSAARRARALLFVGGFATLLSLMQVLPAVEVIANSSRASKRSYKDFSEWSVNPRRLPELVVPSFFGHVDRLDDRDYWGRALESDGFPYLLSLYFGAAAMILASVGASRARREDDLPRLTLVVLAGGSLLLSLGSALPFFHTLWKWLPLFTIFRYPVKAVLIAILPVALLAGAGIDELSGATPRRRLVAAGICFAIAAASGAAILMLRSNSISVSRFLESYFGSALGETQRVDLRSSVLHTTVVLAAATLILLVRVKATLRASLLAAVIAADVCVAGASVNGFAPREFFEPPAAAKLVRRTTMPGRFYHAPDPPDLRLRARTNDVMWLSRWKIEELSGYSAAAWGIPVVLHKDYDGLAPQRIGKLVEILEAVPWERRIRTMQAAGVTSFMTTEAIHAAGVVEVSVLHTAEAHPLHLYTIPSTRMARFVSRAVFVKSDREMLGAMVGGLPYDMVALTTAPSDGRECGTAPVEIVRRTTSLLQSHVNAPCRGWVVLAENDYPGWITRVDGRRVTTARADYTFVAIPVLPGRHVIERRYAPRLPLLGACISAAALAILLGLQRRFGRPGSYRSLANAKEGEQL